MASTETVTTSRTDRDLILELRDVGVTFDMERGSAKVLEDINLEVERGEILGIVGESGSGKSMCASTMLDAVVDPGLVTGEVLYHRPDGETIDVLSLEKDELQTIRWEELSMVVQSADESFNPTMTIGEHFRETLQHHDEDIKKGMEHARELLEGVYLPVERTLESYPLELSGGMRQRALIALSLVLDPEVLVMDEPTATLDLLMQRSIVTLLDELKQEYDLTLVFVTHDLPLVSDIADRLAVLYAFEFIEIGPTEELVFDASHPYTRALINAVPNVDSDVDKMMPISGTSPDPVNIPTGCSFHPRCPLADDVCRAEDPPLEKISSDHTVACFYSDEAADAIPLSIPDHLNRSEGGGDGR